jgi:hypothetical protein
MAYTSMRARSAGIWLILVATFLLFAPGLRAQDNATITGTVIDASGAVVPNTDISLTNPATGQIRESKSNEAGLFRFANLGVGTYSLTATAGGFQKFTRTGIVLNVAQNLGVDVTLTVGSAEQSVTVESQALQVQTESSEISTLISGEQVRQLATNGRNVVQLAAWAFRISWPLSAASMLLPRRTPSASMASAWRITSISSTVRSRTTADAAAAS